MKKVQILFAVIVLGIFTTSMTSVAQTAELTVVIKGVKETKGKIMIAAGDLNNPQEMISDMIPVVDTETMTCILKNIPAGKINLYIYQDMNENFQLDKDENKIPIEPCYTKEKITVKEGENKIEIKLINVKEMMG
jgi:Uncharacterized protein conserved in bacteria (DUF2141).